MASKSVAKPITDQRNPLIEDDPVETSDNIKNVIAFLSFASYLDELTQEGMDGQRLILEVVEHAAASLSETLQANGANHG